MFPPRRTDTKELEGLEFQALPSGLHLVETDTFYFHHASSSTQGRTGRLGVTVFHNKELDPDETKQAGKETGGRGRLMLSLGVLMGELRPLPALAVSSAHFTRSIIDSDRRELYVNARLSTPFWVTRSRRSDIQRVGLYLDRRSGRDCPSSLAGRLARSVLGSTPVHRTFPLDLGSGCGDTVGLSSSLGRIVGRISRSPRAVELDLSPVSSSPENLPSDGPSYTLLRHALRSF